MLPYIGVTVAALAGAGFSGLLVRSFAKERAWRDKVEYDPIAIQRRWTILDLFALFGLIALAGMRAISVGTDTNVYEAIFWSLPPAVDLETAIALIPQEPGYTFVSIFVKSIGGTFTELLWILSAVTVIAAYWALKRTSKNFLFSLSLFILMGFYFLQFNVLRQGVAVSILFLAATFLGRKRGWMMYLILGSVAITFHMTAIVPFILLPLFSRWKVTWGRLVVTMVVAGFLAVVVWASPWVAAVAESLSPRYTQYLDWHVEAGVGLYLILIVRLGLLLYATRQPMPASDMRYAAWMTLGIGFSVLGTQSVIGSRLDMYFLIFLCVLIPNVMTERRAPAAHTIMILIGASAYFVFYMMNYSDLVPYVTS